MESYSFSDSISKDDFGFLYGFSLFETFLVNREGSVFLLAQHIDRLYGSIHFFKFDMDIKKDIFQSMIIQYIHQNMLQNKVVRVSVSYGNKAKNIKPSVSFSVRDNPYCYSKLCEKGLKLTMASSLRVENSPVVRHKTANYLENYLEGLDAKQRGFDDALFINTQGEITETTKSNLFFVKDNVLYTPEIESGILPGIIRDWIIKGSGDLGINCITGRFPLKTLLGAEEVFVTNSVMGIAPVANIDNHSFMCFKENSITKRLIQEYEKYLV
ncbi:MAG: aminotransferase class IV [Clostridia bacterium]|nr:aminotransferase class IV [Clostridia bacterium]